MTVDYFAMTKDGTVWFLVHADGGECHGTVIKRLPDGSRQCPMCGIFPDMQSTEFWREDIVRKRQLAGK